MDRAPLEKLITTLNVRDPLKSILNPRFELGTLTEDGGSLLVSIRTFGAETGEEWPEWKNPFSFSAYMAGRFLRDPTKLAAFAIQCVLWFVRHEAEESVFLGDKLAVPPLHNNAGRVDSV